MDPTVTAHNGRVFKRTGDGLLVEFRSVIDAVRCAIELQSAMPERNAGLPPDRFIEFRIGVHLGEIVEETDGDLMGDGVNIAARLEGISEPNGVCLSAAAYDQVRDRLDCRIIDLGERDLKNIKRPIRAYQILPSEIDPAGSVVPNHSVAARSAMERSWLAVLPFQNLGGDQETDYFADGIVEDIITALSRTRWLFVIARNSSFIYKHKSVDARQVGRELGVRYLLEGSIRKAGQRVRIAGQLIEASTGRHIWADRFDGDLADIFDLQDSITTSVVVAVEPRLRLAEIERAQRKPTDNLGAYDLYLRALPSMNAYTRDGFVEAETMLRRAIALDPSYADALAALAECLVRMTLNGWAADKMASTAEACELAGQAVAIDPENAAVLAIAAWAYSTLGVRFEQSLEFANHALALHPNSMHVRSFCGWVFNYFGESLRAIEQFEEARRLSPVDPRSYFPLLGLACAHFFAGHFEETVNITGRILAEVPTHNVARRYRAAALGHLGRLEEAGAVIADILKAQPASNLRSSRTSVFRDHRMSELYVGGLEKAGLPD
ncbi:adenylate/guanylate cyclase domain-containing protein [Rhizobium sp. NXC24]|uniref:adenylate/guanylate cyclase domain-containing protein n=1 Tax=Rhizobium sp. NXC24 TaxID=2048897 RepID=UPI000CF28FB5|nr:adenylate/guanylate cyclase domain-containing protein [Rhizobium sp. NXC24]